MRRIGILTLLGILLIGVMSSDVYARGSRSFGGGGRSRSSWGSSNSRSSSSKSTKPSSSWSNRSSTKTPTTRKVTTTKPNTTDKALISKAKTNGTYYKSRDAAVKSFREKNASKYSSKYSSKPATRPEHIPQSTTSGGKTYNITYNQSHGGYGYMGPSGAWIMYDAMADAAMMSMLMTRNGYVYERPHTTYVPVNWDVMIWVLIIGGVVVVIAVIVSKSST